MPDFPGFLDMNLSVLLKPLLMIKTGIGLISVLLALLILDVLVVKPVLTRDQNIAYTEKYWVFEIKTAYLQISFLYPFVTCLLFLTVLQMNMLFLLNL